MQPRPLVLLEFNELSPVLMDKFIAEGHLPNFARLKAESYVMTTDAGEDPPNLNPWIQWVTFHSGQSFAEHGVFHLGDAGNRKVPMIWDAVSEQGHSSWVCGSMNIAARANLRGAVLPDPWDAHTPAQPAEFEKYMRLIRSYVFEYTSERRPVTLGTVASFLSFMASHGLRFGTVARIVKHLMAERVSDVRWKRASILDWLQFDLFRHQYLKTKPLLATFFSNSTAHYQHVYWRNMQPEIFSVKPGEAEQKVKGNAVLCGYQEMDRMVGEVFEFAGPDTVIAFATALSQQPCLAWEGDGGKTFYKVRDFAPLLAYVGIDAASCRVEPVMSEQFHLRFADAAGAARAQQQLVALKTEKGKNVFYTRLEGDTVFAGCGIYGHLPKETRLTGGARECSFFDLFYQVESLKSGMHHRDGIFWVRVPGSRGMVLPEKVPLTAAVPLLMRCMRLENPSWLKAGAAADSPLRDIATA